MNLKTQKNHVNAGLYTLLLTRLKELDRCASPHTKIIRFPFVFEKLCRNFSMKKEDVWELLFFLREMGVIEIVPYQGIRLLSAY